VAHALRGLIEQQHPGTRRQRDGDLKPTRGEAEEAVRTLLRWAGDDPSRDGLLETPKRVTKAFEEWFGGYDQNPREILNKTFEESDGKRVLRSSHIPLRPDRDYPPGCLMVIDDITEFIEQREQRDRIMAQLISKLLQLVGRTDPMTATHPSQAALVAEAIAKELDLNDDVVRNVRIAANLMNVGRGLLPNGLLGRSAEFTPAELEQVRAAIRGSAEFVKDVDLDSSIKNALPQVHERVDGGGPLRLAGEAIALEARIVAVADAFAAMISPRAWRPALSIEAAWSNISDDAGGRFDRRVVAALLHHLENQGGRMRWASFAVLPS